MILVKINKVYKFRIYPTLEQQKQINKTLGCTRLIYNYYLNKKQTLYNTNKQNIKITIKKIHIDEAENLRCEPRNSNLFEFCSLF